MNNYYIIDSPNLIDSGKYDTLKSVKEFCKRLTREQKLMYLEDSFIIHYKYNKPISRITIKITDSGGISFSQPVRLNTTY